MVRLKSRMSESESWGVQNDGEVLLGVATATLAASEASLVFKLMS